VKANVKNSDSNSEINSESKCEIDSESKSESNSETKTESNIERAAATTTTTTTPTASAMVMVAQAMTVFSLPWRMLNSFKVLCRPLLASIVGLPPPPPLPPPLPAELVGFVLFLLPACPAGPPFVAVFLAPALETCSGVNLQVHRFVVYCFHC
jgi:hypothetical protein